MGILHPVFQISKNIDISFDTNLNIELSILAQISMYRNKYRYTYITNGLEKQRSTENQKHKEPSILENKNNESNVTISNEQEKIFKIYLKEQESEQEQLFFVSFLFGISPNISLICCT